MARGPRKVSMTSGQGVSRRSYQVARSLGQKGTGDPAGGVKPMTVPATVQKTGRAVSSKGRDYSKTVSPISATYTKNEMDNPTLKDLQNFPKNKSKPTKGFIL